MLDDQSASNRRIVRVAKFFVIAAAATIAGWYAMQFRAPRRAPMKTASQQVAVLRDRGEKQLARRIAAEAIQTGDSAIAGELAAELSAGDAVGREFAALALGQLGDKSDGPVDALIAALNDPEREVRRQAAIALGRIGDQRAEAAAALVRSLQDADPAFRSDAFKALARCGETGIARLLGLLENQDADVRRRAVIELGGVARNNRNVVDPLRGRLHDSDAFVRAEAYAALARQDALSLDDLIVALHDDDYIVRSTACTLLGRMGPEAAPAVGEIVGVFERDASRTAAQALRNLGADSVELNARLAPLLDSDKEWKAVETTLLMGSLGRASEADRDRLLAHVDSPDEGLAVWAFSALRKTGLEGQLRPPELISALAAAGEDVHALILYDPSFIPRNRNSKHSSDDRFVRGYGIVDADLPRLTGLRRLRLLDLRYNPVGDAGLEHVAAFKELERLNLDATNVTSAGMAHLAGLTRLRWFTLADCGIDDAALEHLKDLASLEFLDLSNTKVTDAGMRSLAGLAQLKELRLYGTQVTDAGLAHLRGLSDLEMISYSEYFTLRGLAQLKSLSSLRPRSKSVADDDLALLAEMPRLRELDLSQSQITDAGLAHVGQLAQLKSLSLGQTAITDAGLTHIAKLTQLEVLTLNQTAITDAGLSKLKTLIRLKFLGVDKTRATETGLKALAQSLPKLESRLVPAKPQSMAANQPYEVVGLEADGERDKSPSMP